MTQLESQDALRMKQHDLATRSWVGAVLLGVFVALGGVAWTFTFFISAITALAFIYGGFAYGIVGMTIITIRWVTVPRQSPKVPLADAMMADVRRFATGPQRNTFILNILLLLNLAAFLLFADYGGPDFVGSFLWGSIAPVAGLALIISNGVWAYHRQYIIGEYEAVTHRIGRYRLIAVNRVLSYLVWISYTAAAGLMAFWNYVPGWSSAFDPFV